MYNLQFFITIYYTNVVMKKTPISLVLILYYANTNGTMYTYTFYNTHLIISHSIKLPTASTRSVVNIAERLVRICIQTD